VNDDNLFGIFKWYDLAFYFFENVWKNFRNFDHVDYKIFVFKVKKNIYLFVTFYLLNDIKIKIFDYNFDPRILTLRG